MKARRKINSTELLPFLFCLLGLSCLIWLCGCVIGHEVRGNKADGINGDPMKVLRSAIKDAEKRGDGTVNIILGEVPELTQEGDLVSINYSLSLKDGGVFSTNIPDLIDDPEKARAEGPLEILAGYPDMVPGLHNAVLGMKAGETREVVIPPEEAYGLWNEDKVMTLSLVRSVPRKSRIPMDRYLKVYKSEPSKGDIVSIVPYFPYEITEITDKGILLEAMLEETSVSNDAFGTTRIAPDDEIITLTLEPKLGAFFKVGDSSGRIVSKDDKNFTVDCNHPLAGESLILKINPVSISKASTFINREIFWFDEHDEGLTFAAEYEKPAVVVLYADWCDWCKRLFNETMKDPRVTTFSDDFEWIRANSDLDQGLKELYGQNGFPFIAILNSDGKIINRLSGFKYAYEMREELKKALEDQKS